MARIFLVVGIMVCLLAIVEIAMAQGEADVKFIRLNPQPKFLDPAVDFIENVPTIDGRLDESLKFLPERPFTFAYVLPQDSIIPASYRLAYGACFFYIYIEVAGDQLIFRDRAYQNGDGFHMVIGAPQPAQAPTSDFYVLSCSAVNKPSLEWSRRVFWYYNVDRIFLPTSDEVRLEFSQSDGKISFELLLPWSDVHPYHPWLSNGIGFNLRFVKAMEPDRILLFGVLDDPYIGSEQRQRDYVTLTFKPPTALQSCHAFAQPVKGHIERGDSLEIAWAGVGPGDSTVATTTGIYTGEGERVLIQRVPQTFGSNVKRSSLWFNTSALPVGGYMLKWSAGDDSYGERGLTILPAADMAAVQKRIDALDRNLSISSVSTLRFLAGEAQQVQHSIRSYETGAELRTALDRLMTAVEHAEQGIDDFAHTSGFVRKAYQSRLDSSLQPYMVWVPSDYVEGRRYPLMVYLHGSASDERSFAKAGGRDLIPDGFVAVAPYGRGKSNAFSADHAQEDIAEVIEAVCRDYSIDTSAILLTGFSMGGYGVLRTAYETPAKFRALAIMSGDPNLAQRYSGDTSQVNFLEDKNLAVFKDLLVFVFHGEKDMNCPYETARELVSKLQKNGAHVTFISEPEKGHDSPSPANLKVYKNWVAGIFSGRR